jgi:hypothetical protein
MSSSIRPKRWAPVVARQVSTPSTRLRAISGTDIIERTPRSDWARA